MYSQTYATSYVFYFSLALFEMQADEWTIHNEYRKSTQNYWVFRFSPSSVILETRKHNFSKIGSVSVLR
jgi:hypothetical protein